MVATKSFHLVNLLTGQLDSQRIFVPCEARILWYSADRTSSRALRDTTLFLVVYVFTQHATAGQAPIEMILPEARRMPLYRLINDPFRALQERGNVKGKPEMADLLRPKAAAA